MNQPEGFVTMRDGVEDDPEGDDVNFTLWISSDSSFSDPDQIEVVDAATDTFVVTIFTLFIRLKLKDIISI